MRWEVIKSLINDTVDTIEVNDMMFSPGVPISLVRVPEIYNPGTFGRVLSYVTQGVILGLDLDGESLSTEESILDLNRLRNAATTLTPYSQSELLQRIRDEIDVKTQRFIISGFEYEGLTFPCPLDQQMNFKATFDIRSILTYPFKVKGLGQTFLLLQDPTDVFNWFMTGFQHIHGNLQVGWQMKDDVAVLTRQQLIEYTDPR